MDAKTIIDSGLTEADKVKLAVRLGEYEAERLQERIKQFEAGWIQAQVGIQQLDYLISKFASVVATLVDDPEAYDVLATLKNALEVLSSEYYILWSNTQLSDDNDLWKPVESEDFNQLRIKREAEQSRLKAWQEMAIGPLKIDAQPDGCSIMDVLEQPIDS